MSIYDLERAILASAQIAFRNPRLRLKDLREWSTGDVTPEEGEVALWLPDPGVNVVILKSGDKRQAPGVPPGA